MKLNGSKTKKIVKIARGIGIGFLMSAYMYSAFIGMVIHKRGVKDVNVDF